MSSPSSLGFRGGRNFALACMPWKITSTSGMVDDLVYTDLQQGAVAGRTDQHLAVVPKVPDMDGIPLGV